MQESALSPLAVGSLDSAADVAWYRVEHTETLDPFFMVLSSSADGWGFLSSTGALTAGRRTADEALFPYRTEDQLLELVGREGSRTVLGVPDATGGARSWIPFAPSPGEERRTVAKTVLGDEIVVTAARSDLGLRLGVGWRWSPRYGLVRETTLVATGASEVVVEVDDGVVQLLPPGSTARVQRELSTLLDAYKITELDRESTLAWTRLNAALTDLAEPAESLRAATAWSAAPPGLAVEIRPPRRRAGRDGAGPERTLGIPAAYRLRGRLRLLPGEQVSWRIVLDTAQDAASVADLCRRLRAGEDVVGDLEQDLAAARRHLRRIITSADGEQCTGDATASAHHTSSVLFNAMRGGVPVDGLYGSRAGLIAFLRTRRHDAAERWDEELRTVPERFDLPWLADLARTQDDPDLRRLLLSYLPLTFSRRHGDPSRPWNRFEVAVEDEAGRPVVRYEGNWRDILQNWEALGVSFPPLLDPMVRVVLDAMTVDGHNPYRLATEGPDWEVPEPEDPWSNIGYWSDHQVVYLHHLLRRREELVGPWDVDALTRLDHVYADVPYRIAPLEALRTRGREPMVRFDAEADAAARGRAAALGGDGLLRPGADGDPARATMLEKLVLVVAAKLVALVPGGGIWMTTQRPEWNDANNALVGKGVSVVTAAQLRAFVADLRRLLATVGDSVAVSAPLAALLEDLDAVLRGASPTEAREPHERDEVMLALGRAGERFREAVHGPALEDRAAVSRVRLDALLQAALEWLDDVLAAAHRQDGLVTSYLTLDLGPDGAVLTPLGPMLEGQVAVLAGADLDAQEAVDLLDAVRRSDLWCPERRTFLLYPDRDVDGFLRRAAVPERARDIPLLRRLVAAGDGRIVREAGDGRLYLGGDLRNGADVEAVLDDLERDPAWRTDVRAGRGEVLAAVEATVHHASFTGRAGTFFAYEGLGSVYWHMVSKYLAAAQETLLAARAASPAPGVLTRLEAAVEEIRDGLGYRVGPHAFGAVAVDPYSHTPAGRGARQPGMTGQVKEDILIRWADLGLRAEAGVVTLDPRVPDREWLTRPVTWHPLDVDGSPVEVDLGAGSLGFTWCGTPVVYRRGGEPGLVVRHADGREVAVSGWVLPAGVTGAVIRRDGSVTRITVSGG